MRFDGSRFALGVTCISGGGWTYLHSLHGNGFTGTMVVILSST